MIINYVYELRLLSLESMQDYYIDTVNSFKKARQWVKGNIQKPRYIYYYIQKKGV